MHNKCFLYIVIVISQEIDYQGPDEGVANNTLPLNEVYDHENRLGRIVSGTQLVDFCEY